MHVYHFLNSYIMHFREVYSMKKIFAILIAALMLLSCAAFAEENGRTPAEYTFALSGEDKFIENLIFNENVVISGDGSANIYFINCQFNKDIINTCDAATRVFLLGSEVSGNCIFRNTVTETTIDAAFPKYLTDAPVNVVTEDCFGIVIAMGDFPVTFNGVSYDLASVPTFLDAEGNFVSSEGQEFNLYWVASWTENGELQLMHVAEFDATM